MTLGDDVLLTRHYPARPAILFGRSALPVSADLDIESRKWYLAVTRSATLENCLFHFLVFAI